MPDEQNIDSKEQNNKNNNSSGDTQPENKGGKEENRDVSFDFSKIPDEQLAKVLEDPRLFKLDRIKELRDSAKELKTLKEQQAKEQEEALKKKGEFEQLAEAKTKELEELKNKFTQSQINNKIMAEASKQGIKRLDLVDKLIDKTKIELNEDGNITGIEEAVKALLDENDFLKSDTKSSLGGGSNPSDGQGGEEFTITQIQDPIFYQKNRDAIQRAQALGKITDDRN